MKKDDKIRILMLEDSPRDAGLIEDQLKRGGIHFKALRVETRESFLKGLKEFTPDIVLCDYALPTFDGLTAIKLVKKGYPLLPVIMVTGSINEDTAVKCIKQGADDYVIKEHLVRLPNAVITALAEADARDKIRNVNAQLKAVTENSIVPIISADREGNVILFNQAAETCFGYSQKEVLGKSLTLLMPERFHEAHENGLKQVSEGGPPKVIGRTVELMGRRKNGEEFPMKMSLTMYDSNGGRNFVGFVEDITESRESERKLKEEHNLLRTLIDSLPDKVYIKGIDHRFVAANKAKAKAYGDYSPADLVGKLNQDLRPPGKGDKKGYESEVEVFRTGKSIINRETSSVRSGKFHSTLMTKVPWFDDEGKLLGLIAITKDNTEIKKNELELVKHRAHLEEIVLERTAELQKLVNLMTGREIRMMELKETIKNLQSQLKKAGLTPVEVDPLEMENTE